MDKDFDKKIRASFEESAPRAPEGIWATLDGALSGSEQQMDQKLKEAFAAEEAAAPESVWTGINRQLTIDQAWIGINRYLNRRLAWQWTQRLAAILLLAIGIYYGSEQWQDSGPANYIDLDLRDLELPENPESQAESTKDLNSLTTKSPLVLPEANKPQPKDNTGLKEDDGGIANTSVPPTSNRSENPSTEFAGMPEQRTSTEDVSMELDDRSWLNFPLNVPDLNLAFWHSEWQAISASRKKPKSIWRDFSLGFEYSYNRDVLSNNIYRESQDPRSLIRSNPVYTNNYKIVLHYHWHKRWSLKLGLQPQRDFLVDYNTFREGQYVNDRIGLSYSRIGLGMEYHKSFNSPFGMSLGLEPYYALLNDVAGVLRQENYDDAYGLQFRLGADWYTGPLVFSMGIESDFNFNNLYLGDGRIPAEFDLTLYRSWGLYVGSRYRFF